MKKKKIYFVVIKFILYAVDVVKKGTVKREGRKILIGIVDDKF